LAIPAGLVLKLAMVVQVPPSKLRWSKIVLFAPDWSMRAVIVT
jgi:hypothetical protein